MKARRGAGFLLGTLWLVFLLIQSVSAQSTRETIETVFPRVVKIYGAGGIRSLQSYSTGFLVKATFAPQDKVVEGRDDVHIITTWNHVLDNDQVTVVLNDGRRFEAKVLGAEPQLHMAVLKPLAEGRDLPYFELGDHPVTAGPGTRILAFSNMFKVASGDEAVSVLHGVISSRTKMPVRRGVFEVPYDGTVYIVDAITNNSGAAGGVITTRDGKLLGMIGKELRNAESNTWVNYAIPISELSETIRQIITGDYVARKEEPKQKNPNRYSPIDFGLVMVPDVLFRTPAFIDSVLPASIAADVKLRADDIILFVNEELIQSIKMLNAELGKLEAGDTLRLIVRRNDELISVEIPVERKKGKE
ncbi:MAG: serine protease [Planctomycetes bacterium]|nr:serine protease [Planctomycetota bacterium]